MSNKDTKTFNVMVTKDHISKGKPKSTFCCPLALAINNREDNYVLVTGLTFRIETKTHIYSGKLSERAGRFVRAFDKGLPMSPKQFRLTATSITTF